MRKYKYNVFVSDFETSSLKWVEQDGEAKIWLWAITNAQINKNDPIDMTDNAEVVCGTDFESWIAWVIKNTKSGDKIYFHNIKFDGRFICYNLRRLGWRDKTEIMNQNHWRQPKGNKTFSLLADPSAWYSIQLCDGEKNIEIRDSLKRIPMSVKSMAKEYKLPILKGDIDYDRDPSLPPTKKEMDYIRHDVLIPAEITRQQYQEGFHHLTLASYAYASYTSYLKSRGIDKNELFPPLMPLAEGIAREAYDGGEVYVNPRYAGRLIGNPRSKKMTCFTWDINSMYPAVMSAMPLPYGYPAHSNDLCNGSINADDYRAYRGTDKRYFVRLKKLRVRLKPGRVPSVGIPVGMGRRNFAPYFETEYKSFVDVRFEMILDDYIIEEIEFDKFHVYNARTDLFYDYIKEIVKEKNIAAMEHNLMRKALAKVKMNSLYGKFGQKAGGISLKTIWDDIEEDVEYEHISNDMEAKYVPIAAVITAEARLLLISQANKFTRSCVSYTDTDSIHVLNDVEGVTHNVVPYRRRPIPKDKEDAAKQLEDVLSRDDLYNMIREFEYGRPDEIWCDEYDLGAFKIEGQFACAKYLRAKTYFEATCTTKSDYKSWIKSIEDEERENDEYVFTGTDSKGPYYLRGCIKGAGLPDKAKMNITADNFQIGLVVNGRLIPRKVKGGCVLVPGTYEIKDDKTVLI